MTVRIGTVEDAALSVDWKISDICKITENENKLTTTFESHTFLFGNAHYFFQMWADSFTYPGFVVLYVARNKCNNLAVEYTLGVKNLNNSVEQLVSGIMSEKNSWSNLNKLIELSKLLERKSELMPSDILTITCSLKFGISQDTEPKILENIELNKLIRLDTLSDNLKSLFLDKESCDTTLLVMDKEYKAHKAVLMARSSVFGAMFRHETSEKQTGTVNISDCDPESFGNFLEFLYSGKLENPALRTMFSLYQTADKYNVQELKTFCSEVLVQNLTAERLCDVVIMANNYNDAKLFSVAQCFFNKNLSNVFATSEWNDLLTNNRCLANKLLMEMSSKMKAV